MIRTIDFLQSIQKIAENLGYINGDCGVFAIALANLLGPNAEILYCEDEDDLIAHCAVKFENRIWDADGETTESGLKSYCSGEPGQVWNIPIGKVDIRDIIKRTNPSNTVEHFEKGLSDIWHQMQFQAKLSEENIEHLQAYGYQVVETVELGAYDLTLTYMKMMDAYHIAMQRDGRDFADIVQQTTKFPEAIGAKMSEAIPILNRWIRKYKILWISGNDSRKVRVYEKILRRLGYKMESYDMFGTKLITIDTPVPEKAPEPTPVQAKYKLVRK